MAGNAVVVAKMVFQFLKDPHVRGHINTYVVPLASTLLAWYNGPSRQNATVREIEARHRQQPAETVQERDRRMARELAALEEQHREEEQAVRSELANAQEIKQRKCELLSLRGEFAGLGFRVEAEEMSRQDMAETAKRVSHWEQQSAAAMQVEKTREAEEENRRVQVARQAEEARKTEEEKRRIEIARQIREVREAEAEQRRIEVARQAEEANTADEQRRLAEVASEERRIEVAKNLQATIKATELKVLELQHQSQEARRKNAHRIRLATWPPTPEYEAAKEKIQFDPDTFNFAIAGCAGTGKSSLINVFLNLTSKHKDAARTGAKETTLEITRYPDPGDMPPRKWIVWYDVPGAGTTNIPALRYFNHQCLFLMDIIIVVVGFRFTEIDLEILRKCMAFDIKSMIVRSMSDTHIENKLKIKEEELEVETDEARRALRLECRAEYIAEARDDIASQLQAQCLPPQDVYLVSCLPAGPFRKAYSAFAGGAPYEGSPHFIDEMKFIYDLTFQANKIRGGLEGDTQQDVFPAGPSGDGISVKPETNLTDQSHSQTGVKARDEVIIARVPPSIGSTNARSPQSTPIKWRKQYYWGREPGTAGSQASSRKYTAPGRGGAVPIDLQCSQSISHNPRTVTPVEVAIGKIKLSLSHTSPVSLSAGIIREIDTNVYGAQILVLSTTRNLAIQIHNVLQPLGRPMKIRSMFCVGGGRQPHGWHHIVSGTPKWVTNSIQYGSLRMMNIRLLILNMELDKPEGINQQIYDVYRYLPPSVKIVRGIMDLSLSGSG